MSGMSLEPVQQAVYAALTGDTALMALISGVYDRVPEQSTYPYVRFGQTEARDESAVGLNLERVSIELEIYSRSGGRKQSDDIFERIHTVLHDASLSLAAGFTLSWIRVGQVRVRQLSDGLTWQGRAVISALVEGS